MAHAKSADDLRLPIALETLREILVKGGAVSAWVFGSYSRGEQNENSDLDLLIEMDPNRTGWDFAGLVVELEAAVPVKVDVTTKISRWFAPYIEPDLLPIL
ncbi:MAG: nucleotidyltransferase domain-containing protein [Rhodococcus sp. (in: high G+C Gram-positive bacteria)]|uniref:nucleotidyltransferase family protein n=1 Tax=Rhodococcus sp. TaxID=1831 RepID=UPI003BB6AB7B